VDTLISNFTHCHSVRYLSGKGSGGGASTPAKDVWARKAEADAQLGRSRSVRDVIATQLLPHRKYLLRYGVSSNWKVKADRDLLIARTK
jgi:hypothetical protein